MVLIIAKLILSDAINSSKRRKNNAGFSFSFPNAKFYSEFVKRFFRLRATVFHCSTYSAVIMGLHFGRGAALWH